MDRHESRRVPGDGDLKAAFAIRREVFVDEQGVTTAEEFDGNDEDAIHQVIYAEGEPVGTARLRSLDADVAKIERVAVRERFRGRGIGRTLVEQLEHEARQRGASEVVIHAQTAVEAFYERLGYGTESGVFEEDGIPHVRMRKRLE